MGRVLWPVKWLLAPALAALLGYGLLGPRLAGKQKGLMEAVQEHVGGIAPSLAPPASGTFETPPDVPPDDATKPAPAPQVSVGVKPVDEDAPPPRRRRHRRHRAADDEAPPEASSNPDHAESDPASTP